LDAFEQPANNTTINNNNNSNNTINNNFNINVFLNETCKDAINLDLFIKNLVFELTNTKLMCCASLCRVDSGSVTRPCR
jgi:hypothetical protein